MALNFDYYGKQEGETTAERIAEASEYFAQRLHETAWSQASDSDREKALIAARGIIDSLNFKGSKHAVYTLYGASPSADSEAAREAEATFGVWLPRLPLTAAPSIPSEPNPEPPLAPLPVPIPSATTPTVTDMQVQVEITPPARVVTASPPTTESSPAAMRAEPKPEPQPSCQQPRRRGLFRRR